MYRNRFPITATVALSALLYSGIALGSCRPEGQAAQDTSATQAASETTAQAAVEAAEAATEATEAMDEATVAQADEEAPPTPSLGEEAGTELPPRDMSPEVEAEAMQTLVQGNTAFGFALYQALREHEGNLFFSPYSISTALAMTYAGASGNTESQMAETMRFLLDQQHLHPAFNALSLALNSRGEAPEETGAGGPPAGEGDRFRLNVVNAIWAQQGFRFLPEFLAVQSESYGAERNLVDFAGATEAARQRINVWVSEQTEGKIEELISEGVLDSLTRMVLTNAIYFTASWSDAFDESATQDEPFHLLGGGETTVPMMAQTSQYGYHNGEGFVAVELPYFGNELSMVVLLPDEGLFEAFEASLSPERVTEVVNGLSRQRVALKLPRFTFSSDLSLANTLAAMGMADAFSMENADFTGMTGERDLYISAVIHQAFVAVDESGTEAAAATAVVMSLRTAAIPREPVQVVVDRPFLFLIRDIPTGTILFMGRVMNPA